MSQNKGDFAVEGKIVDVLRRRIFPGEVLVKAGRIASVRETKTKSANYIMPGFVDAHVHIESSMLTPSEFARVATAHGTLGSVSDPHEIANVCGMAGINFMLEDAAKVPFQAVFGAPSCVPATAFETAGAEISPADIENLLGRADIRYLSEMMNYPGVIHGDPSVMEKIGIAKRLGKPIDGHAPGLRGPDLKKYAAAGISTDHECFTIEEASEKLKLGMKILIREGSAAKNFDALIPLLDANPDMIMFCSDDKHPNNLVVGHINEHVRRALKLGIEPMKVFRAACLNPVQHYGINLGLLTQGDTADFIVVSDIESVQIEAAYLRGELVSSRGKPLISPQRTAPINNFSAAKITVEEIEIKSGSPLRAIGVINGQLITTDEEARPKEADGALQSSVETDTLKIVVVNRYKKTKPAAAFVRNFGLRRGAIASSVAHDSHNIIAVGVSDAEIASAVNLVVENRGGLSLIDGAFGGVLPLPIAGLMSPLDAYDVAAKYEFLDKRARDLGSQLNSPFMTLSFLALLVIPKLKLSDLGLFDGESFRFVS